LEDRVAAAISCAVQQGNFEIWCHSQCWEAGVRDGLRRWRDMDSATARLVVQQA
jgi:hypothetical protein